MASWVFGVSKLKADLVEIKDTPPVPTINPEPVTSLPTTSHLSYDLQPIKPKTSDENKKATSMLDNIPFVLSNDINININSYNCSLEEMKKCLLSVKNVLDSDVYNYDFSNDRRLAKDTKMYVS